MNTALFTVAQAQPSQVEYALQICEEMAASAQARGTGIARRNPVYIAQKMIEGKAVIALHLDGTWAGFCYIETWSHGNYVANSGLIVNPIFRNEGLAKEIKSKIFELSRTLYPTAKIFGLTTGFAVMKINSDLGYRPVPYSELTQDESFWKGCESCINFSILSSKEKKNCLCTALLWNPEEKQREAQQIEKQSTKHSNRLMRFRKRFSFLKLK
ncbi:GNAT family N-acetyltransferase [Flavobacterium sp. NKUCC04_CG]|uniref:GNAT family N-acetyltransferase n=1 Tax=Flavobacterium sp. NKUCC04_CG TaxID=2842121 RepID=UPI001C5A5C10|nr:GNAT family N-acetyltransferase [Flavobacterium sp. NKUCC04_CG]MBW3518897.1 GNAT family N-acetyltransferase [Flavobacterium sp. NKUCC04_CG]